MTKYKVFENNQKKIVVFHGLCKGCGICIAKCPQKVISFSKTDLGYYSTPTIEIDLEKCNGCGLCEIFCPDSGIRVDKKPKGSK